jgi:steroid delta-isomerase-like uncharacterized protein
MPPTPDAVVRQWFKEVWEEGREESIDRLMAPDALVHGLAGSSNAPVQGPAGFKPFFQVMRAALGDIRIDVKRTIVEGEMCAAHCHVRARHTGDALGAPATGRPVDLWGVTLARVQDGRIVEGWNCFEFLSMYQQLGWVRDPVLPA